VSRRTRRWPLCIFFQLLNIAGVNGNILPWPILVIYV
jgi:hypothetical protein